MRAIWRALLLLPLVAGLFIFLLWPLAVLGFESLHSREGGWSMTHYVQIVADPFYRGALLHSLLLSAVVALTSTLLCLGPAWLFAHHDFRGKRAMRAAFTLPMSLSGIMVGFFAIIMLGRIGVVPRLFEALTGRAFLAGAAYQMTGLIIAYLYFEIPRGMLTLESSLAQFDRRLDLAARSLGASGLQRFFWIVVPLIWPSVLSTFSVTFSVSLGSFGVALILSRRFSLLPLELFHEFTAYLNTSLVAAMAFVLIIVASGVNYFSHGQIKKGPRA